MASGWSIKSDLNALTCIMSSGGLPRAKKLRIFSNPLVTVSNSNPIHGLRRYSTKSVARLVAPPAGSRVASHVSCKLRDSIAILDSHAVPVHTVHAVKSLYETVKGERGLHFLSDSEFSTLVSFYGTLSVLSNADEIGSWPPSLFRLHPTARVNAATGSHWTFVAKIGYDMKAHARKPSTQDRFWFMHAALEKVKIISPRPRTPGVNLDLQRVMSYARQQYRHLHNLTYDGHVHVPWLIALISTGTAHSLNEALFICARLIRRTPEIGIQLQIVIWRTVLVSRMCASEEMRHEFCVALRRRLGVGPRPSQHNTASMIQDSSAHDAKDGTNDDFLDLGSLHSSLASALFSNPDGTPLFLGHWAGQEVRDVVNADTTTLWRALTLFALTRVLLAGHLVDQVLAQIKLKGELRTWSIVSVLVVLQFDCHSAGIMQSPQGGAHEILWSLWKAWLALGTGRRRKRTPLAVERILWLAYIRAAGDIRDGSLLCEMCAVEPFKLRVISTEPETIPFPPPFREAASIVIAAAAARCGARTWDEVLCHLESAQLWEEELALRKIVSETFIREWTRPGREARVAFRLYTEATPFELVSSQIIHIVANACLRDGLVTEAFACLADPAFCGDEKAKFVDTLLGRLRCHVIRGLPKDMAVSLGSSMLVIARSQLVHARSWEWALSVLARSECASLAVDIALVLAENHPWLCSRRWWTTFTHQLCHQRLFRFALDLVKGMPSLHHARRAMCLALVRRAGNASASNLARQAWRLLSPGRVPAQVALLEKVGFRGRTPTFQDSRFIVPFMFPSGQPRQAHPKTFTLALHLLARSGRRNAAKRLYKYIQSNDFDPALKALASNIFLSGSLRWSRRRNAQQFRGLIKVINRLVLEDGFVPDRVTLNILLKAVLRWRVPVDAGQLRLLFDRVVNSGFPTADPNPGPDAPDHSPPTVQLPFGTPATRAKRLPSLTRGAPAPDGPIAFGRHVRPLYKMFAKAFRGREDWEAARMIVRILAAVRPKDTETEDGQVET